MDYLLLVGQASLLVGLIFAAVLVIDDTQCRKKDTKTFEVSE